MNLKFFIFNWHFFFRSIFVGVVVSFLFISSLTVFCRDDVAVVVAVAMWRVLVPRQRCLNSLGGPLLFFIMLLSMRFLNGMKKLQCKQYPHVHIF